MDQLWMGPFQAYHHEDKNQDDDIHHMWNPCEKALQTFSIALDNSW